MSTTRKSCSRWRGHSPVATCRCWCSGTGSNLLVADAGFPGLAISLGSGFDALHLEGNQVRAGAALSLPVLARRTAAAGLHGLEWAVGVPGSVGGAIRMNAGGHGSDTAATLVRYRYVDLLGAAAHESDAERLQFGYRLRGAVGHRRGDRRHLPARARRPRRRRFGHRRDRPVAAGQSAGRVERRIGVHQPGGRRGRPSHRGLRSQRSPGGECRGLGSMPISSRPIPVALPTTCAA